MSYIKIHDANESDFEPIVRLNAGEEIQTSPLDMGRMKLLHKLSSYHKIATVNDHIVGFLLAMRESAPYMNDNFLWFSSRYRQFIYIDRIVVSKDFARMKIGSYLYNNMFGFARATGVNIITCEYNIEPSNLASKAFHDKFGFREVGTQRVANGSKLVSLQVAVI